jgi:hypothetical protein
MPPKVEAAQIAMHNGNGLGAIPMRTARLLAIFFTLAFIGAAQKTTTYVAHYLEPFPGPQAYKDPDTGTLLYVETDGRHLAALSGDGKLLWNRDPFMDAHLDFYRTEKPQIVYLGPVSKSNPYIRGERDKFVAISFNNSQFGVIRIRDGDFKFLGQD